MVRSDYFDQYTAEEPSFTQSLAQLALGGTTASLAPTPMQSNSFIGKVSESFFEN
jgi:hypothetical protein